MNADPRAEAEMMLWQLGITNMDRKVLDTHAQQSLVDAIVAFALAHQSAVREENERLKAEVQRCRALHERWRLEPPKSLFAEPALPCAAQVPGEADVERVARAIEPLAFRAIATPLSADIWTDAAGTPLTEKECEWIESALGKARAAIAALQPPEKP